MPHAAVNNSPGSSTPLLKKEPRGRTPQFKNLTIRLTDEWKDVWSQLCEALPDHSQADLLRDAILARATVATVEDRHDQGGRVKVRIWFPKGGQEVDLLRYPSVQESSMGGSWKGLFDAVQEMRKVQVRGAREGPSQSITLGTRLSGKWLEFLEMLKSEVPGMSDSDLVRQGMAILAAVVVKDASGQTPMAEIEYSNSQGKAIREDLRIFLALDKKDTLR